MKVKLKKAQKTPALVATEQAKNKSNAIEYVSISLKEMIENAKISIHNRKD